MPLNFDEDQARENALRAAYEVKREMGPAGEGLRVEFQDAAGGDESGKLVVQGPDAAMNDFVARMLARECQRSSTCPA